MVGSASGAEEHPVRLEHGTPRAGETMETATIRKPVVVGHETSPRRRACRRRRAARTRARAGAPRTTSAWPAPPASTSFSNPWVSILRNGRVPSGGARARGRRAGRPRSPPAPRSRRAGRPTGAPSSMASSELLSLLDAMLMVGPALRARRARVLTQVQRRSSALAATRSAYAAAERLERDDPPGVAEPAELTGEASACGAHVEDDIDAVLGQHRLTTPRGVALDRQARGARDHA